MKRILTALFTVLIAAVLTLTVTAPAQADGGASGDTDTTVEIPDGFEEQILDTIGDEL
ncbi:hypothetical protein [Candidatus Poriferisodalis sp.]|uniref:hypothetical protein n=1 Tax=Candidatus Poriferisodalis sp. TaxID=3101277 RepID=UPI003B0221CE